MNHQLRRAALALAIAACAHQAQAQTALNTVISMDNGYVAYLSTSDNATGTAFASFNDWTTAHAGSAGLATGVSYYLHVYGYDQGGPAAFAGQFTLSGGGHVFENGQATLLTDSVHWRGNTTGFNGSYGAVSSWGTDGSNGTWGNLGGLPDAAERIWIGDLNSNDVAYFSTRIAAVPEPTTWLMMAAGLAGLALVRRRA